MKACNKVLDHVIDSAPEFGTKRHMILIQSAQIGLSTGLSLARRAVDLALQTEPNSAVGLFLKGNYV